LYEAAEGNEKSLKELIMNNPLLTKIKGVVAGDLTEEEKHQIEQAERKIEIRKQDRERIILEEGGEEIVIEARESIKSVANESKRKELERKRDINKKYRDKMKKSHKKNTNPGFLKRPKKGIDSNKECIIVYDSDKAQNQHMNAKIEAELKKEEVKKKEEKKGEEEEKLMTIEEKEIPELDLKNKEKFLKEGEYVYELFAILVHSGSAYGGHYFAYIKDITTGNWYSYNDVTVRHLRISEIQKVFGTNKSISLNYYRKNARSYKCLYVDV